MVGDDYLMALANRARKDVGCKSVEKESLAGKLEYGTKFSKSGWQRGCFWVSATQRPEIGGPWSRDVFGDHLEVTERMLRLLTG